MKIITFEEYQKKTREIFKKVNNDFILNNIFWFGIGGTALGAARDGKFIQWDDDIDMAMKCSEYLEKKDKIIEICKKNKLKLADKTTKMTLNNSRLISEEKVLVIYEKKIYLTSYFIDLLLLTPIKNRRKIKRSYLTFSNRYLFIYNDLWHPLPHYKIKNKVVKIKTVEHILTWIGRVLTLPLLILWPIEKRRYKNSLKKNNELYIVDNGWSHINYYYTLNDFIIKNISGIPIYINSDYENELTIRYGDNWREKPPIEKRKPHHIVMTPFIENHFDYEIYPFIIK